MVQVRWYYISLFYFAKNQLERILNVRKSELVVQRCFVKKVVLEISQNSQENTCARVFLSLRPASFLKKRLWHRCLPVNFAKFVRTPIVPEHFWTTSSWEFRLTLNLELFFELFMGIFTQQSLYVEIVCFEITIFLYNDFI